MRTKQILLCLTTIIVTLAIGITGCNKPLDPEGDDNGGNGGNVNNSIPENAVDGKFSISENQYVFFSKGNLLYNESTQTWRFAEHQYDYYGTTSFAYSEWIDMFDWNTNGAEHGDLSAWRPLTHPEWDYILYERSTISDKRFAKAMVSGINGLILFPDDWKVDSIVIKQANDKNAHYNVNRFDAESWEDIFESNGAVFLPAAGWVNSSTHNSGTEGAYWSATQQYPIVFNNNDLHTTYSSLQETSPFSKLSVRLVYYDGNGGGNQGIVTSPIIETGEITSIGRTSACCSYLVFNDEEDEIHFLWGGICYDSIENPTIHSPSPQTSLGNQCTMRWLSPNTQYYVRAYAKYDNRIVYGEQKTFTTLPDYPCYINGKFSISDLLQVYFSQGNLQYQASTNTWRFAENQWDYVGTQIPDINGAAGGTIVGSDNHYIAPDYSGWIDLFAWGSATNPTVLEHYTGITHFVDWGEKPIINAGGHVYPWRTLTDEEWEYLFYGRQTPSQIRFAKATVNNIKGLIILPDDWSSTLYNLNNVNNADTYTSNTIDVITWKDVFEAHGAVFLPCGGMRVDHDVWGAGTRGYYWSTKKGWYVDFIPANFPSTYKPEDNYKGLSVRLVWCIQDSFK